MQYEIQKIPKIAGSDCTLCWISACNNWENLPPFSPWYFTWKHCKLRQFRHKRPDRHFQLQMSACPPDSIVAWRQRQLNRQFPQYHGHDDFAIKYSQPKHLTRFQHTPIGKLLVNWLRCWPRPILLKVCKEKKVTHFLNGM